MLAAVARDIDAAAGAESEVCARSGDTDLSHGQRGLRRGDVEYRASDPPHSSSVRGGCWKRLAAAAREQREPVLGIGERSRADPG